MARKNRHFCIAWFCMVVILAAGCAPAVKPVSTEDSLRAAMELERKGDLAGAIDNLRLVLTLNPEDPAAREQLARLLQQRDGKATRHYQTGLELKRTDPAAAQREFLAALRCKNDYPAALAELRALQQTVTAGKLVKDTPDSTYPAEGAIEAMPFDDAVALYNSGDYAEALQQFQALRSKQTGTDVARYISLCYYKLAIEAYQRKEYQRSQELFAKVGPNFERTSDYLAKIRKETADLADKHYKMGLQCYRDQKLNEAIAEWQKVLELDANHAKAREYISKANKLLEALKK